jgi:predicted ATPase
MQQSDQMRRLSKKWSGGGGWPKRLEWLEIGGIRGWAETRIEFSYPIVAVIGENGSGKSTVLQSAAAAYRSEDRKKTFFASDFFPDTAWEKISRAWIRYSYQEGPIHHEHTIRKPTTRWLGNVNRPYRPVSYIDLSRIQPVSARVGYAKIAKTKHKEASSKPFDAQQVKRLSDIMGREYEGAKMALSTIDSEREVPVITKQHTEYSGFHQGSGETTMVELLRADLPKYGLVLIDEIESSLHPRSQRRLIRELAERCRDREVQIILTTHSPYIIEELPLAARLYILESRGEKHVVPGVSPQFAMTKMDDEPHPECDLYVEDRSSRVMLGEILAYHGREIFVRCSIIPFGSASVGHALGQMVAEDRFVRPTCVFLDGDNAPAAGCILLPGDDAPERVVYGALKAKRWGNLWSRIARDISLVTDSCVQAMTLADHHDWIRVAANQLMCSGNTLWQAMCAEWAQGLAKSEAERIVQAVEDALPG